MPRAILHTASRVIRCLTIDPLRVPRADETEIVVPDSFSLDGGPWKLDTDGATKLVPTSAELDAAFTSPLSVDISALRDAAQALYQACTVVEAATTLPQIVRDMAAANKAFLIELRNIYRARRSE